VIEAGVRPPVPVTTTVTGEEQGERQHEYLADVKRPEGQEAITQQQAEAS
jgi:hypothetical protein